MVLMELDDDAGHNLYRIWFAIPWQLSKQFDGIPSLIVITWVQSPVNTR